jgi:TfoX/Sxy family transcriptional regulator of competence genes
MASMKWVKPSAETIKHFERIAPGAPLQTRSMFGMPCRFLNGHMLVGVFQNSIMLRLSEKDRALCIAAGAKPFRPMGREMKGYVELAPGTFDDRTLKQWIAQGMRFLGSLPPKLKTAPSPEVEARPPAKKSVPRRAASVALKAPRKTAARTAGSKKKKPTAKKKRPATKRAASARPARRKKTRS